jgi:hypothetical protein
MRAFIAKAVRMVFMPVQTPTPESKILLSVASVWTPFRARPDVAFRTPFLGLTKYFLAFFSTLPYF